MLHRIYLVMRNKPVQSWIAILLSILVLSFEFTVLLLNHSANEIKNNILRDIGITLNLSPDESYLDELMEKEYISSGSPETFSFSGKGLFVIDDNLRGEIEALDHVVYTDYTIGAFMVPLDFANVNKHSGYDPSTQNENADRNINKELYKKCINLIGCYHIDELSSFRRKQNQLIDGEFPTQLNQGILISDLVAKENNLSVGDQVQLASIIQNESISEHSSSTIIIGIYHTDISFEITESNFYGEGVYAYSPYNRIFADYETACLISNQSDELNNLDVYLDSPQSIKAVEESIKKLPNYDSHKLEIDNYNNSFYESYAWQLDKMIRSLSLYSNIIMVLGIIIYLFVMSFWYRDHLFDIGLLTALGEDKKKIALQKLIECLVVSIISVPIAIISGTIIAHIYADMTKLEFVSDNAINMVSSFITNENNYSMDLLITVDIHSLAALILFAFILSILSAMIPIFTLIRYNAREILLSSE